MQVVAIIAQKGGTGKTTVTLALAVAAQRAGQVVAVIDLDPQATATNWSDRRPVESPVVVSAQPARLPHVLTSAAASGAELVLIDTPPRAEQAALAAAKAADLILIPCRAAIYDLETVSTTLELIRFAGEKPVTAILTGVPPRGAKRDQAEDVLQGLGVTVCPAAFGYRAAFNDAGAVGLTAQEYDPGGKADAETVEVYTFMSQLLNSSRHQGVTHDDTESRRLTPRHAGEREGLHQADPNTRGHRRSRRTTPDLS